MKISFVDDKRMETLKNRGLDMARAHEIFEGRTLTYQDDRRDYGETRFIAISYLDERMVVIVWTERNFSYRIISLRKANDREQREYQPRMG